jgi:hypothetical protein
LGLFLISGRFEGFFGNQIYFRRIIVQYYQFMVIRYKKLAKKLENFISIMNRIFLKYIIKLRRNGKIKQLITMR